MDMRRYFTSGALLGGRLAAVRQDYIRAGGRVAAARPECYSLLEAGGNVGDRYTPSIDAVCGAPARRGGACVDRLPARRRRPPRRLLRAVDHGRSARHRRRHGIELRGSCGRRHCKRQRLGSRAADRGHAQGAAARRARRRPVRRLGCPRVHDQRQQLALADRGQGRPRHRRVQPRRAQSHLGSERRHRAGAPQGTHHRLHRHQPGCLHVGPEDRHDLAAQAGHPAAGVQAALLQPEQDPQRRQEEGPAPRLACEALPRLQEELLLQPQDTRSIDRRLPRSGPAPGAARAAAQHADHRARAGHARRALHGELPRAGQEARRAFGQLRERGPGPPAELQILRPLAPRRARAYRVAGAPLGQDRGAPQEVRHGRRRDPVMRRAPLIVAAFAALACLAAAGAPFLTSQARAGAAYPKAFTTTDDASAAHALVLSKDGIHCLQIVANLRAEPPEQPVVILLGGSSARESTIDDVNWAAQILRKGGPTVLAYNLGSKHDTFEFDLEVAKLLPKNIHAIVYIGINIGRFCNSPSDPTLSLPDPEIPPNVYYQHVYSIHKRIQSASLKRYYVRYWLTRRWPEFKAHYSYNIKTLDQLIVACQNRGLHPVPVSYTH